MGSFTDALSLRMDANRFLKNYNETLFVYDFDDTLMWAQHWWEDVYVDENSIVLDAGSSNSLKEVMSLEKKIPYCILFRKIKVPSSRRYCFELITRSGKRFSHNELKLILPNIDRAFYKHINFPKWNNRLATITRDNQFYENCEIIGKRGFREDGIALYNGSTNNIILTARREGGMARLRISKILEAQSRPPLQIFLQPKDSLSSGNYKAEALIGLASHKDVKTIFFYDDSKTYIRDIRKRLKDNPEAESKINIHYMNPSEKPSFRHSLRQTIFSNIRGFVMKSTNNYLL